MKSKAAIGAHPIHPMLVPIPIGSFALALFGDILYASTAEAFWYRFAFYCLAVGIISALVAAAAGLVDYLGVKMSAKGKQIATTHLILNLSVVAVYAISLYLRWDNAAMTGGRWATAMVLEIGSFLTLGVSGWLGGKLSYEHKVGVAEFTDREANEIGRREAEHHPV